MWDKFESIPSFEKSSKLGISDLHVTKNLANNYLQSEKQSWRDTTKLEVELREFLQKQEEENRALIQKINSETREKLDVEKKILYVQNACYEWLWIDCILENNNDILKFVKWIVDWFAFEYIEALYDLIESWLDEFIEWLKSLLNVDTILELIKSIWDDFEDIYNVLENPYDWWKAIWWLWLWMLRFLKLWNVFKKVDWKDDNFDDNRDIDLWAINNDKPWTISLSKMREISEYEVGLINNPKTNLNWILEWIDVNDYYIFDRLVKKWNDWIWARLGNMINMVDYILKHPWNIVEYKQLIIQQWYRKLLIQINNKVKNGSFKLSEENKN